MLILIFVLLITILLIIYLLNKIYFLIIIFLLAIVFGIFYTSNYRDINGLTWLLIDGTTYKQKVSSNFKFKNKNLIAIEFNRNIIYQLKFELYPYKSNKKDIIEFENMMKHIKNTKIYMYTKNSNQIYKSFHLYQSQNTSWSAGTVIYQDDSRQPFVIGFESESFFIPPSLKQQKIYFKFDINNKEVLNYLNNNKIKLSIIQKSL
ncbi:hypothetical protein [Neisseria zalophi]|uniref:Uncharacterized protein n=1 Tax=Neisseria zalophi TaxID=640030 RepID=A0A5J6Q092_9NEIS|nr:hypothetical protein [Neisseria zalophi]QEY26340.1 hypothetical protein D0T92_07230 [Neisseria zalophi]